MANATRDVWPERTGQASSWTLNASVDEALTYGHKLTLFVKPDTGAGDTVIIELSPDGTNWVQEGTYTSDTVKEIPGAYKVRATWTANSKVYIHGISMR